MELTRSEIFQVQYLLPAQGDIETLVLVQLILDKLHIKQGDEKSSEICKIDFSDDELSFLNKMITVLSDNKQLHLKSLPLVLKLQKRGK